MIVVLNPFDSVRNVSQTVAWITYRKAHDAVCDVRPKAARERSHDDSVTSALNNGNARDGDHLFVRAKHVDALCLDAARICKMGCTYITKREYANISILTL